jgi:SAM-dependent methyltransferase
VLTGSDNLFALDAVAPLLREELSQVPAWAARQPAGRALLLHPSAASHALDADVRHLRVQRLHVEGSEFAGDLRCAGDALPYEDGAFQLVFCQHAGDLAVRAGGLVDELARVLAPGGVLLWCGLSPWSPWLVWMNWQARRGGMAPRPLHADSVRERLRRHGVAATGVRHLGSCWPAAEPKRWQRLAPAPLRAAYLLEASKQRAILTPLRPRVLRERVAIQPHLAAPSRRACA